MEAKRGDDFEAGTVVGWDVDSQARTIASFCGDPVNPVAVDRPGDFVTAKPAVPGWQRAVAELFRSSIPESSGLNPVVEIIA